MHIFRDITFALAGLCFSLTTLADSKKLDISKPFLNIEIGKVFPLLGSAKYVPHPLGETSGVGSYYIEFNHDDLPFNSIKVGATPKSKLVFTIEAMAEYPNKKSCKDELTLRRDQIERDLSVNFSYGGDEDFYTHRTMIDGIEIMLMCFGTTIYTESYTNLSLGWSALKELE